MREENGFWVDANNNKWHADRFAKEEAAELSETLTECSNCVDCSCCGYCEYCIRCVYCHSCTNCVSCNDCERCKYCSRCSRCTLCKYCSDCSGCLCCNLCIDCRECSDFNMNPMRVTAISVGGCGNIVVYWLEPGKEQCIVGRVRGTLQFLKDVVYMSYTRSDERRKDFLAFIESVRSYQKAATKK